MTGSNITLFATCFGRRPIVFLAAVLSILATKSHVVCGEGLSSRARLSETDSRYASRTLFGPREWIGLDIVQSTPDSIWGTMLQAAMHYKDLLCLVLKESAKLNCDHLATCAFFIRYSAFWCCSAVQCCQWLIIVI